LQPVPKHFGAESSAPLLCGDGRSAVDVNDTEVAQSGEVFNSHSDAGVIVTADRINRLPDIVAKKADDGHLAGVFIQVLVAEGWGDQDESFGTEIQQCFDGFCFRAAVGYGA
jgi:hypothetical protein